MNDAGFQNCPILGTGLGLRRSLFADIMKLANDRAESAAINIKPESVIDWLEITPENYMRRGGKRRQMLETAAKTYPLVAHGVSMSIGSTDPWDEGYLKDLAEVFEIANPPWFSDHLCFSSVEGVYFNDLMPLPRSREAVKHVVSRIQFLQDRFQKPVLIENISQYFQYPDDELRDAAFLTQILEAADCGLLLDVNNVYVNSQNFAQETGGAKAFISALPLERVVQIHVAGHHKGALCLIDTHGAPVCDPVWELLEWTMAQPDCRPCGVMLERDNDIPVLEELLPELQKIQEIWIKTKQPKIQKRVAYA